ncbi:B3 domain-containing protein At1g05930-like [Malania oleifera]|uniref:B3 domain-containing protein At1g05930-like n=1 Tax=Malania oleifera TaxID=397392 RepID=UPI0025ADC6EB|nr:B3 domain-containing protein At1g05930-like [Malania oleifera]
MEEEKELRVLSMEDFRGSDIPADNPLEQLLLVAAVASSVLRNEEKKKEKKNRERGRLAPREKILKKAAAPPVPLAEKAALIIRLPLPNKRVLATAKDILIKKPLIMTKNQKKKQKIRSHLQPSNSLPSLPNSLHIFSHHHPGECSTSTTHVTNSAAVAVAVPEMSHRLKNRITEISGTDVVLVIQKKLSSTDVSRNHNRLSIPLRQVKSEFLTAEEKDLCLSQRNASGKKLAGMEVPLVMVDRPHVQYLDEFMGIQLKKWDMKKEKGSTSSCYVLVSEWNDIVARTGLRSNDDIQLWSFRRNTHLCFALQLVT